MIKKVRQWFFLLEHRMSIFVRGIIGVQLYMDAYGNEGTPEDFGLYKTEKWRWFKRDRS